MSAQQRDSLQTTPIDAMAQFYEGIFEKVVRRVLDEHNAKFPSVDSELATQMAKINAKPNITVSEAALLLNCSESHLYTKIAAAACERTGIEDLRPYDLRHTFATRLVERNVQTIIISELLGHAQPLQGFGHASRITPGYTHATYDAMRWAVHSLERPPQITAFEQKSSKWR